MAYVTLITKNDPVKLGNDVYVVSINVSITDNVIAEEVFNEDFSVKYNENTTLGDITSKLQSSIKEKWDKLVDEQSIKNMMAFDTLVTNLTSNVNNYINE